jgi:type I restriction enzyme S subunit
MPDLPRKTLDALLELRGEKITVGKDPTKPYVGLEHLAPGSSSLLGWQSASASISTNAVFEPGDVLFGKLRPNLRKCIRAPFAGYCSTDILVLRARSDVDPGYAFRVMQRDETFAAAVNTAAGTKMPRTSWRELKALDVFCPTDVDAQRRIATVLDAVDDAIAKAETVIEKLENVRSGLQEALCNEVYVGAATPLKPLAAVAEVSSGVTLGRRLDPGVSIELPYLRVANVQEGHLDLTEVKTVRVLPHEVAAYKLEVGDVLMTEGGDWDKLGRGTIWRGEVPTCLHQNHIFKVRADRSWLLPEYLAFLTRCSHAKRYFRLCAKQTSNLASINTTQLRAMPIPCPDREHQQSIIDTLSSAEDRIDAERATVRLLSQVKSGLASDLLSGRVPVHEGVVA